MEGIRKYLIIGGIILFTVAILFYFLFLREPEKENNANVHEKGKTEEVAIVEEDSKQKDQQIQSEPIKVGRFGWRPIAKTVPKPGYIWEWAVEITNQTPVTLTVQITYELEDQDGISVGRGIGGENIPPNESRIIVGQSSSPEQIENARRQRVRIMASPSAKGEE
ncbi:MAG: hypothetical protein RMJ45_04425, partial [Candidatus Calescibacterium sp.]|nr:hypothetical protein [Candidatus Calescibacterium sp.]